MVTILVGKSAAGKDTLRNALIKEGYKPIVTYTTRPMRPGETQGVEYHFLTESEFKERESNGFFLETASYDTVHGKWFYGSAVEDYKDSGDRKIIILNPTGLSSLKKSGIKANIYYLKVSDNVRLKRLSVRGDDTEEVKRRFEADKKDFAWIEKSEEIIPLNGEASVDELADLIMNVNKVRELPTIIEADKAEWSENEDKT